MTVPKMSKTSQNSVLFFPVFSCPFWEKVSLHKLSKLCLLSEFVLAQEHATFCSLAGFEGSSIARNSALTGLLFSVSGV